ncbi:MAG TPA: hypothetical protein VGB85_16090 [Nannocystis sp.]
MLTRHTWTLLLVTACQGSTANQTGFGSGPEPTTTPLASTGEGSTSSSSTGTSTSEGSGSGSSAADTSAEPPRDLGVMPDFGNGAPIGCQGKIDLLFVISRHGNMLYRQEQLALAFPQFVAAIEAKFTNFDYHIMVVTGDPGWGNDTCTQVCPTPTCKIGEDCCPLSPQNGDTGQPCCHMPDYPCQDLDLVTPCDRTWGAGEVFPAGTATQNKPCAIDGDRRYLVKGQTDLAETFECIATVGASGYDLLGQALTAAMQKPINDPGGCNNGFLRDDALLMVTFISTTADTPTDSEGTPAEWAKAVLDAKHGDDRSVVAFDIGGGGPECLYYDRICHMTEAFPYHHHVYVEEADYGPGFLAAASLVETACAGFVVPG